MIRLLRLYLPRARRPLAFLLVVQVAQAVLVLYLPRITADVIDQGVLTGDTDRIWNLGTWMLVVALAQAATMTAGVYLAARTSMGLGRDMRSDLFHRVTAFSSKEVTTFGAPTLITRITNDVQQLQMMLFMSATTAIVAPATALFGIYMALREDAPLSSVLLVAVVVLGALIGTSMRRMSSIFGAMQDAIDQVNRVLREQITGLRVVRAFVREDAERRRFDQANARLTSSALSTSRVMALLFPIVMLVQNVASVAVVWWGAHRVASGGATVGSLFAFLGYVVQVLMAAMMASFLFAMLPRAAIAAGRILEVLDEEPSVVAPSVPRSPVPAGQPGLELRDASFGYPGAEIPVLTGISFAAEAGTTTAIVGSTGAGKTTLVNLVPRLVDVTGGAVLVDGVDVRDQDLAALWQCIGYVPQRTTLFSGTVATNLRFGREDAEEDELWAALTVAQAADFVEQLPGGLDAPIAQGGSNLSGGQRQRLAIARALVRRPQIYLFDDSFSALDVGTEARLRAALPAWAGDATVLSVAQRISTIRDADQIVVLDEGRVAGLGHHDDLLDSCPTYREIVESQMSVEKVGS